MDNSHHHEGGGNNVRRRHSAQQHEESVPPSDQEEAGDLPEEPLGDLHNRMGAIRRNLSAPTWLAREPSPTAERILPVQPTLPAGTSSRVRFSEDIERGPSMDTTRSGGSGKPRRILSLPANIEATGQDLSVPPSLIIQTGQAGAGPAMLRHGLAQVRSGVASSSSPDSPTSIHLSPVSPAGRNRGLSLRRSLFARSVQDQVQDPKSTSETHETLELREQGNNNQPATTVPSGKNIEEALNSTNAHPSPDFQASSSTNTQPHKRGYGRTSLPNYQAWFEQSTARISIFARGKLLYKKARRAILRISELQASRDGRHIDLDAKRKETLIDERTGRPYVSNIIRSSRYTLWTFLPRQLFAQFSKLANLYVCLSAKSDDMANIYSFFLCVSILQMIPCKLSYPLFD